MTSDTEPIYNPEKEFSHYHDHFRQVAERTFNKLATASKIDIEANRALCREIDLLKQAISKLKSKLGWMIALCVLLWIAVTASAWCIITEWETVVASMVALIAVPVVSLVLLFAWVHPTIKRLRTSKKEQEGALAEKTNEAWAQMEPLNRLYDWDIFSRMMTETMPHMQFDPFFTTKRLADLVRTYGWDEAFNSERSVLFSHSGLINGNPFVICRTRKQEWGTKEYTGSITIYWTTMERGSDGKMHTRHHSQVLTATVSKPFPLFPEKTRLIYGNTSAPNLTFNRTKNYFSHREGSFTYRRKLKKLQRKSQDLDKDYVMSTNEEFEVLFTADDRNDNQQYFLLFTPLAQESMVDLIRDTEKVGYGDDFDFHKRNMINTIVPDHVQKMSLDMNPSQFVNYSFDAAQKLFVEANTDTFRAIYFCLAPLMCIPLYQQMRPLSDIYGREMPTQSSYWEHEALANFWGQEKFKHPDCVTDNILKTSESRSGNGHVDIQVQAFGFRSEPRIDYVTKLGGDGKLHTIPVHWDEYLPVVGNGGFVINEDTSAEVPDLDPISRRRSIDTKCASLGAASIYRRHIISALKR